MAFFIFRNVWCLILKMADLNRHAKLAFYQVMKMPNFNRQIFFNVS